MGLLAIMNAIFHNNFAYGTSTRVHVLVPYVFVLQYGLVRYCTLESYQKEECAQEKEINTMINFQWEKMKLK